MRSLTTLMMLASFAVAAEPKLAPLDGVERDKVPARLKPPKSAPPGTLAMLGLRDGRWDTIAARPDGKLIAAGDPAGTVVLWSLPDFKQVAKLSHERVVALAFSPSGKTLAAGDAKGGVRLWTQTGNAMLPRALLPTAHKEGPVWSLAFSPDGKTLATAGPDQVIKFWNVIPEKPTLKATVRAHEKTIYQLAFSPDGSLLASAGSSDKVAKLWDVSGEKPAEKAVLSCDGPVASVAFAPDGQALATASFDGKVRVWKLDGDKPEIDVTMEMPRKSVRLVQFSPGGDSLAALLKNENDETIAVCDRSGKKVRDLQFNHHVDAMAFVDAHHLATTDEDSVYVIRVGKP
jgi:WD40 repeat protein